MYRVLVVDDEKWIRRGLIQSINWEDFGLELVGEAENGDDAYTLALEIRPDLIFLDMRMPGMDGRAMLGKLSGELPDVKIIVISGYSDFDYTREAIRYKVFDYLLKPVRKEELNIVLAKACEDLRFLAEIKETSLRVQEGWLRELVHRHEWECSEELNAEFRSGIPAAWLNQELAVCIVQPDVYSEHVFTSEIEDTVREQLSRMKPMLFNQNWDYEMACIAGGPRELIIALSGPHLAPIEVVRAAYLLQQVVKRDLGLSVSLGLSKIQSSGASVHEAYKEAEVALKRKLLQDTNVVLEAGNQPLAQEMGAYPCEMERELLFALQTGSLSVAVQVFTELMHKICISMLVTVSQLQRSASLLVFAIEKQLQSKGLDFEHICSRSPNAFSELLRYRNDRASIEKLFKEELFPSVVQFYQGSGATRADQIVEEMKKQVEDYYDQPLSLQGFAHSFFMNQDYLSRIFKKITGRNFIDYLTDVRICKSKALLRGSNYKNYEIAQMVGYEDYRYFSQIFKKRLGMTIGEYRNTCDKTH